MGSNLLPFLQTPHFLVLMQPQIPVPTWQPHYTPDPPRQLISSHFPISCYTVGQLTQVAEFVFLSACSPFAYLWSPSSLKSNILTVLPVWNQPPITSACPFIHVSVHVAGTNTERSRERMSLGLSASATHEDLTEIPAPAFLEEGPRQKPSQPVCGQAPPKHL